jgi:hypothetical protein
LALLSIACIGGEEEIQDSASAYVFPVARDILISGAGIGPVRIGLSLDSIAKIAPNLDLNRTSDGEGVALVEIPLGLDTVIAYTGEEDPSAPVDPSRRVISVETMTPGFRTPQLIHPGSLVRDAESVYGKIVRVEKSEIESREYVTFANQPAGLTFRLEIGSGVFESGSATTTKLAPRARIFSISVRNQ